MAWPPDVAAGLSGAARDLAVSAFKTRELHKLSIPVGLISGIIAGMAYNRFSNIELPSYLSFFGGRRFVAIATGVAGVGLAALIGTAWPVLEHGMDAATQAIEFTLMFLAPLLYGVHAVATGLAMVVMNLIGVRLGFSFSAGLFDYVLNFSHAQRPLLLLPFGLAYAALYYGVFRYCIARFDLATPGREPEELAAARGVAVPAAGGRAGAFIPALGGGGNLSEVEACTTRLRL